MNYTGKLIRILMAISIMTIPAICTETVATGSSATAIGYSSVSPVIQNPIHPLVTSTNHNSIHPLRVPNHWDSSSLTKAKKSCKRQFAEKALKRDFWGMVRVGLFCPSTAYSY
jgi:hypothetical protein